MGIPVSGPMLQEKALSFAKNLGIKEDDFKSSNGWLNTFRQRNNINFASVCGESGRVSEKQVTDWIAILPDIARGYTPCDIYNMDETKLCVLSLPEKPLNICEEDCKGRKKYKDRITVSLCVKMEGDFEKPIVIRRAAVPRYMKNVKELPVTWKHNKKAWMNSHIFYRMGNWIQPQNEESWPSSSPPAGQCPLTPKESSTYQSEDGIATCKYNLQIAAP